jgi:FMN phosphatase YigB (HAD superfamily)
MKATVFLLAATWLAGVSAAADNLMADLLRKGMIDPAASSETPAMFDAQARRIRWNNVFAALGIHFDGPAFEHYFRAALHESAIPVPGAMELLQSLSGRALLCVASNGPYEQQLHRLEIGGMKPYFDYFFISEHAGAAKPAPAFFDYALYEYIVQEDRKNLAYQPIALFLNNIWDVPAPMRVVATGNTFWNIISSMRPHVMRNFASHSQPMDALVEMNFWSTRTVVEDGHQFWRSYFHFHGNYSVHPLYIPIYQDAVLDNTYVKTFKAQFIQLRRWMYGASDVPYVAERVFLPSKRKVAFWPGFVWFIRELDGYITAASFSIIVAIGGWVPLIINPNAYRDVVAHQLPDTVSLFQQIALIGIIVMVFLSMKMLPPRPERYRRTRTVWMVLQWVLMPFTAIIETTKQSGGRQLASSANTAGETWGLMERIARSAPTTAN